MKPVNIEQNNFKKSHCVEQRGFSLLEMAVVLLILGLLLTGLLSPLSAQRQNVKIVEAKEQLEEVKEALLGFAAMNGRLPCPTFQDNNGVEASRDAQGRCLQGVNLISHGFVPSNTLGLFGSLNAQGLLLDPWGSPVRYSITTADFDGAGDWDFVNENEMRNIGMNNLAPNLLVCASASSQTNPNPSCSNADPVVENAPVVFYSLGRDWSNYTSSDQQENAGEGANALLGGHAIATDDVFVSKVVSNIVGSEYDDIVMWISPQVLYARMMQARKLP
jgi:prepilin-type N-terminal cleavage/methylation domain-containing protein